MMTAKRPAKAAKKAPAKKAAPAKRAAKRAPAEPKSLNLRTGEKYVVLDGANIRHIADTNSAKWQTYGSPICGTRPPHNLTFVETAAKLPVCDNCKAVW